MSAPICFTSAENHAIEIARRRGLKLVSTTRRFRGFTLTFVGGCVGEISLNRIPRKSLIAWSMKLLLPKTPSDPLKDHGPFFNYDH